MVWPLLIVLAIVFGLVGLGVILIRIRARIRSRRMVRRMRRRSETAKRRS